MQQSRRSKQLRQRIVKAYNNTKFLNSPAARTIRVLTELVEPATRLKKHHVDNMVVFFGSSRTLPPDVARKNLNDIEKKISGFRSVSRSLAMRYQRAKHELIMSRYYEEACSLSQRLTCWFKELAKRDRHFFICSGGGSGIMEAANRGAQKGGGKSVAFNISMPIEQQHNPYISQELAFEFHYFFIRKFWFCYLAEAAVIFPGGFGTCDELFELITLIQTKKIKKPMSVILYGKDYWDEIINFEALLKWEMISRRDLSLFTVCDTVEESFNYLKGEITKYYLTPRRHPRRKK